MLLLIALTVFGARPGLAVTGRTVDAKADFGAVGNGVADDTAALQNALDYLSTKLTAGAGVCLYLPAGTYKITNQLTFASANPAGAYQGITIRGNGSDGTNASILSANSTNGVILMNVDDSTGLYNFMVQLQDLQFRAGVANAGAAIEIAKLTGTNVWLRTTPWLRNVVITRANTNCYFTYGFKGTGVVRPIFDAMKITGNLPGMTAGIMLTNHYGYDVSSCFISDADVAIDSWEGGEGNSSTWTTITNVNIGIRMNVGTAVVSSSGGGPIYCNISARQIGLDIDKKSFAGINNNIFSSCGSGPYTNIYANELHQSIISDNVFVGGTNQYGIVLAEDRVGTDSQVTIAYNQFGPFATSVFVDTNVSLTKIINNSNIQTNIIDNGINTYIVHGAMRPFYDSPAAHSTHEDLRWSTNAYAPIINVTSYGAKGDGVTDDTKAITNAAAQLKAALNTYGQGTLYFPGGRYQLSQQIVLSQSGANWQRLAICGDGSQVSAIEATTTNGVFKITCTNQVPIRFNNLGLDASQSNTATGLHIIQQNGTNNGTRSLILQDVSFSATGNGPYFRTGFSGQGLVRPLLQNVWIDLRDFVGATGIILTGGYGFDWQGGKMTDVETACSINSLGGAVIIRGPGFCSGNISTGIVVNAGGGTFAHYRAHINARNNLVVSNASEASYMGSETLWSDFSNNIPSSTLRFLSCTNIYVRDNCLFSAATTNRPLNTFVMLDGIKNKNADISGNMMRFYDYEGTGISIAQGSSNVSVYDNRFITFPAVDITNGEPTAAISELPLEWRPELVGYWDMEEGTNSTVLGRCYVQHGTISGATWVAGKYGTGLYFDGISDSVTTDRPQFAGLMTNFTMMVWVKPEKGIAGGNQGGGQNYVISGASPDTNANHVSVMLSVGTNGIRVVENGVSNGAPEVLTKIDWTGMLSSTAWTHVAVTYSNSLPRLYIGGALVAAGSVSAGKIPHPGGSSWGGDAWGWFKGALDEFRVFDYPLSSTEINVEANGVICDFNGSQATASAFTTAADWDGGVFPVKDLISNIARFNKTSYANQPTNSNYDLNGLIFGDGVTQTADTAIQITGAAGQQLKLGSGGIVMNANAGKATINKIQLGADQSWVNNSASLLSVGTLGNLTTNTLYAVTLAGSGPISITGLISDNTGTGTTAIQVSGATATLSGANTFTGGLALNSGTLTLGNDQALGGTANVLTINGGTLDVTGARTTPNNNSQNWAGDFAFGGANTLNLGAGAVTLSGSRTVTVNGSTVTVDGSIGGAGALTKSGPGTLTLGANNDYAGGTTVSSGTLRVNGSLGAGAVVVKATATLGGSGVVKGPLSVETGGVVQPGSGGTYIATLTASNTVSLSGTTLLALNRTNAQNASKLAVASSLALGGTLVVTNVGPALQAGDAFSLLNAPSFTNNFNSMNLPPLGSGLRWNTAQIATYGWLGVVGIPTNPPAFLPPLKSGTNLVLSGTNGAAGIQYYVLSSTNVTLPCGNWTVIATNTFGPGGAFAFTNAVNPADPARFCLIRY
ncbi:MAG: glycosyl hydrolase family 28-related protein [Verrucomicrobiae bacterium]